MRPWWNTYLGRKFWKLAGRRDHIGSIAVLLNVINQCTRACEMEDSWRVHYGVQREQLSPRQSYDVSFILSGRCLASSLLRAPSPSLILPLSGLLRSSRGGRDEARLSLSHAAQQLLGGLHNSMMHSPTTSFKSRTKKKRREERFLRDRCGYVSAICAEKSRFFLTWPLSNLA